ncbi:hypothetical protein CWI37_0052p0020 [Hamiltosporidium tvaerminnensis]|uniref:Uncharacterized protein n=1 Tax=Hamiltosporidium tvaerminnensis TaxID=1176355 RepID=A0A4Q9LBY4_9MICR|nr:hypothetical protein CWI37_0052p0020 [Hamiltosporidium tvaerminnensis]
MKYKFIYCFILYSRLSIATLNRNLIIKDKFHSHKKNAVTNKDLSKNLYIFESNDYILNEEIKKIISKPRLLLKDYIKIFYRKILTDGFMSKVYDECLTEISVFFENYKHVRRVNIYFICIKVFYDEIFILFKKDISSMSVDYQEKCSNIIFELKELLNTKSQSKAYKKLIETNLDVYFKELGTLKLELDFFYENDFKMELIACFNIFILHYIKSLLVFFKSFPVFAEQVIFKNHIMNYEKDNRDFKLLNHLLKKLNKANLDLETLNINYLFEFEAENSLKNIIDSAYSEMSWRKKDQPIRERLLSYFLCQICTKIEKFELEFTNQYFKSKRAQTIISECYSSLLNNEIYKKYSKIEFIFAYNFDDLFYLFSKQVLEFRLCKYIISDEFVKLLFTERIKSITKLFFSQQETDALSQIIEESFVKKLFFIYFPNMKPNLYIFIKNITPINVLHLMKDVFSKRKKYKLDEDAYQEFYIHQFVFLKKIFVDFLNEYIKKKCNSNVHFYEFNQ